MAAIVFSMAVAIPVVGGVVLLVGECCDVMSYPRRNWTFWSTTREKTSAR